MAVTNKPSATLVIGCHRSGTSLITRCLSAMGLTLADDLIPAQPDNPKGFWEDAGVTAFNESLLNAFQCDWNSVNFAKLDNIRGQRVIQWREKAQALVQDHYPADDSFVIKDPKFSLLIPFWQEVFDELEIDTRYLLTYRPPLSVAASLKSRNGFSREKSLLIWLAYYHACLKSIPKASPVSVVSYDLFMQHPVDQCERIQRQLGIDNVDWPSISTFLNDFTDPSLRHHQTDGLAPLSGFTRGLMEHLEHLCHLEDVRSELRNSRHSVVDEERLNVRLGEFIADDRFRLNLRLRAQNEQYQQRVTELTGWKQEADRVARELSSNTEKYELQISRMLTELAAANTDWQQEVDSLNSLMIDKDQSARSELDSLNQLLEEKEAAFNQEQQRLTAELAESNNVWQQEVDQLNSLMHDKDQSAQSELDSLNQLLAEKEAAFNQEQQRLNAELTDSNNVWQQEVDNLNSLMIEKDQTARSELDQLNHLMEEKEATFNQEQQRLNAELNAAKTEWQQEVDSLNSLMNDKDQSAQSEFDRLNHLLVDKEAAFNQEQQRLNAELAEVRRSYSYRLGRFITWPVRKPFVSLVLPLFRNRHTVRLALTMAGQALRHPLNGLKLLSLRRIRNTMVIVYRRPELGMQVFGHYTDQLQGENQRTPALPVSTGTEIKGISGKISLAFELPEEPRVSVIIPVYNQLDFTLGCLQSIAEHKPDCSFEVIVADDCSSDDTGDVIPPISGIRYIRNPENLGFIRSCNHASEHARGEFVFFLNNDTQVTAGWLDSLAAVFDQHRDAGIVGSRLLFPDGKLQEAGGIVWDDGSGWNFGRLDDPEKPEFNYLKEVDYVSGAALMIRSSLLSTLGRFDERFVPAYYEDTDLAFAARDAGFKVYMQPRSNIVHFEGVTNGTESGSGIKRYQVENQGKFVAKWQSVLSRDHFPNAENLFLARDRSRFKTTVLVVDHYVPHYDRDAGSRSTWQYLQLMVSAGFNVKFIGDNFFRHEPYATDLENMGIEVLCGDDYARNWQQWIIDNAPAIDVIYLQRPHISENYLPVINQLEHRPKIIYFGHDLHFLRLERQHEVEREPQLASEAAQWKQREFDIFRQVDLVYYPSEVEVSRIKQEMPQAQVKAIPLYIFEEDGTEVYDLRCP